MQWYFRKDDGQRLRLPDAYGSPEFVAAYNRALAGEPVQSARKPGKGTLAWLIERYMETKAWADLSPATRKQRNSIFYRTVKAVGKEDYASISETDIQGTLDAKAETPNAARNFLDAMRGLFKWAKASGHVTVDPTASLKAKRKKTDGFAVWTEDDIAAFEARWPLGTRERLAFDVLLYTGLRRGDAVVAGRQHVRDGVLTLKTEKTGEIISIPVLSALAASIAAGPTGDLAFICGDKRRPMAKESFGTWFRLVCIETGLRGRSAHGLRKAAATRLAEAGATVAQLEAWFGWHGGNMASLYTRKADRARLSREAAKLLPHLEYGKAEDGSNALKNKEA